MSHIIEARGRIIVNALATGEISIQLQACGGTVGAILDKKQVAALRRALFECVYGDTPRP